LRPRFKADEAQRQIKAHSVTGVSVVGYSH